MGESYTHMGDSYTYDSVWVNPTHSEAYAICGAWVILTHSMAYAICAPCAIKTADEFIRLAFCRALIPIMHD